MPFLDCHVIKCLSNERQMYYILNFKNDTQLLKSYNNRNFTHILDKLKQYIEKFETKENISITLSIHNLSTNEHTYQTQININDNDYIQLIENWNEQTINVNNVNYYDNHKDLLILKALTYYNSNKDKINQKRKEKFVCSICNGYYTLNNRSAHYQTNKHKKKSADITSL